MTEEVNNKADQLDEDHQAIIKRIARAKYKEACQVRHGSGGRRLKLAGMPEDQIEKAIIVQLEDIGRRVGIEFLANSPGVILEQFAIRAISRNEDTAGLIKSLINSFVLAYLTPELTERAYGHLVGLEELRKELIASRSPGSGTRH